MAESSIGWILQRNSNNNLFFTNASSQHKEHPMGLCYALLLRCLACILHLARLYCVALCAIAWWCWIPRYCWEASSVIELRPCRTGSMIVFLPNGDLELGLCLSGSKHWFLLAQQRPAYGEQFTLLSFICCGKIKSMFYVLQALIGGLPSWKFWHLLV